MANECENRENETNNVSKQQVKGYRKKGLVSEKVLLDRLSDGSIEEAPVITLSSFETDGEAPSDGKEELRVKGSLKPSLSLDVPSMKVAEEAKRPPL